MKVQYVKLGLELQKGSRSETVPFLTIFGNIIFMMFGSINGSKRFEFFQNGVTQYDGDQSASYFLSAIHVIEH